MIRPAPLGRTAMSGSAAMARPPAMGTMITSRWDKAGWSTKATIHGSMTAAVRCVGTVGMALLWGWTDDTASASGTNSDVWIGGNGQAASNGNDDHVTLGQGGVVNESDNSRVDDSGSAVCGDRGNGATLGLD